MPFALAGLLILTLPTPLVANAGIKRNPQVRSRIMSWVWANELGLAFCGATMLATGLSPLGLLLAGVALDMASLYGLFCAAKHVPLTNES